MHSINVELLSRIFLHICKPESFRRRRIRSAELGHLLVAHAGEEMFRETHRFGKWMGIQVKFVNGNRLPDENRLGATRFCHASDYFLIAQVAFTEPSRLLLSGACLDI